MGTVVFVVQLVLGLSGLVHVHGIISGEPPSFTYPDRPQNQIVFRADDAGDPVTLTFLCPVSGSGPPTVSWYREGVLDDTFVTVNGSYVFPNITEADSQYADGDGVDYYCTATNEFGTIRSQTVKAFYATFAGFSDGPEVGPDDPEPDPVEVDVIEGELQWVALECALNEGSTPPPEIEWIQRDTGTDTETVLVEDLIDGRVRFIDDKQWLILETVSGTVGGKEYFCRVTNKETFHTARDPTTYVLNPVTQFNRTLYPNGVRIYKPLTDKSALLVDIGADTSGVPFGIGAAYDSDSLSFSWAVNGRPTRIDGNGVVVAITPSFTITDMDTTLDVKVTVNHLGQTSSTAVLTLLDPAGITSSPFTRDDLLTGKSWSGSCVVGGIPVPTVTFYHNGEPIEGDEVTVIEGGTLSIASTAVEHSGMYQCLAENESGSAFATWFLFIRAPISPTITTSFLVDPDQCLGYPLVVREGLTPVTLSVNLTADPCPTATWTLNGSQVTSSTAGITVVDACADYELGDTVLLFSLTVNEFTGATQGDYAVTFNNSAGEASVANTRVTDRVEAVILDIYVEGMDMTCLCDGDEVKIVCQNYAFPVAVVDFFKNGTPIVLDERVTQSCDTLTISSMVEDDEGVYQCSSAQNDGQSQAISDTILLEYCRVDGGSGGLSAVRVGLEVVVGVLVGVTVLRCF